MASENGIERLLDPEVLRFHRRMWTFQRVGWAAMLLVAVAGLAGLFGSGPFSSTTVKAADGELSLKYQRFWRARSDTPLRIHVRAPAGDETPVWIERAYLREASIENVFPQPDKTRFSDDRITWYFPSKPGAEEEIVFEVRFDQASVHAGRLGSGRASVHFRQVVFP